MKDLVEGIHRQLEWTRKLAALSPEEREAEIRFYERSLRRPLQQSAPSLEMKGEHDGRQEP
jgi:hypothetical protein